MRKILYFIFTIMLATIACSEVEFEINEDYEKAEITAIELYNRSNTRADQESTIDSDEGAVFVTLRTNQDITDLKMAVTLSTGAKIFPSMSVGYQDLSEPKEYEVVSPNKTVNKTWIITVSNP